MVALRLPSVLAMAGAAGLTAVLGRRLFGAPAGLLAGLLFAVLPGTSRYAQEARPYALVTLFAVLAMVLLVRALDRPGRLRGSFYAAAVAGLGLAHLLALSLLAAHAVVVLTTRAAGGPTAGPTRPPPTATPDRAAASRVTPDRVPAGRATTGRMTAGRVAGQVTTGRIAAGRATAGRATADRAVAGRGTAGRSGGGGSGGCGGGW